MAEVKDFVTVVPKDNDLVPISQDGNTRNVAIKDIRGTKLYISSALPALADRKENTLYFKVTDTINNGTTDNIQVSPTMGITLV